jgi:tetratricopeptide (TPR) repeat protein
MKKLFLLLVCIVPCCLGYARQSNLEDSLHRELSNATRVEDRMMWMSKLSSYYLGINNSKSEELGAKVIEIADSSRDRKLMVKAYLYNAERCLSFTSLKEYVNRGLEYTSKALEIARSNNLDEYQAWAYTYLARGARNNGEVDKALNYNNLAISIAANVKNDSLKVSAYNALGNTYMQKDEKLLGFRNYLQALNIAEESGNKSLQQSCYSRLSFFYNVIEEFEKAKDYEFKKEQLQKTENKPYDLLETYGAIGNLYVRSKQYEQAKKYYEKSIALADSLKFRVYKLNGYIQIVNMYLNSQEYSKGLNYFNAHPEVKDYLMTSGLSYVLDHAYGAMYSLTNSLDSAGYYFAKSEPGFESKGNLGSRFWFYANYAYYFKLRKDYDKAIEYWLKARKIGDQLSSLDIQQQAVTNLDSLYQLKGDYRNAHFYGNQYSLLKDSLQKLSREKDLLSLEVDSENRRKEREALRLQEETNRRHNLQYIGIMVAIAAIFVLLVMAGVFSVSKTTIRVLGFFAFIFLFEFIILLADNQIHHWTHGEPLKVLAIKIALIAMLLPLHHWLEKKVIHYLTSREKLKVKGRRILGKWFGKKDADLPLSNM